MISLELKPILNALAASLVLMLAASCEGNQMGLGLTPTTVNVPAEGGSAQVAFSAQSAWTATTTAEWIQLSPSSGEAGDIVMKVEVGANTTTSPRTSLVTVAIPDIGLSGVVTVSQEAAAVVPDPVLVISANETTLNANGGSAQVTVQTNRDWTAVSDVDWITVDPASGISGRVTVTITAAANATFEQRVGKVTFKAENLTETFTLTQYAKKPASVSLSSDAFVFAAEGGMNNLIVTSNVDWTAKTNDSWLTVTPDNGITGASGVVIKAEANSGTEPRTGSVVFTGGDATTTLMVTQLAPASPEVPSLELSASTLTFSEEAGENSISVIASVAWRASSDSNWITIAPASGESGTVTVKITVAANTAEADRGGKVTFTAGDIVRTLIVNQKGKVPESAPTITLSPVSLTYSSDGGTASVSVTADAAWRASADADWITIQPASGAIGTTTIKVTTSANKQANDRAGAVVFTAGSTSVRLSLSQKGLTQQALGGITGDLGDWGDGGSADFNKNNK